MSKPSRTCKACGGECGSCAQCGEPACAHHEFVAIDKPAGCCCNPGEWRNPDKIPPVCESFVGDTNVNCQRCEHDLECHTQET